MPLGMALIAEAPMPRMIGLTAEFSARCGWTIRTLRELTSHH
jgi:hypothetical protein